MSNTSGAASITREPQNLRPPGGHKRRIHQPGQTLETPHPPVSVLTLQTARSRYGAVPDRAVYRGLGARVMFAHNIIAAWFYICYLCVHTHTGVERRCRWSRRSSDGHRLNYLEVSLWMTHADDHQVFLDIMLLIGMNAAPSS